VRAVRPEVTVTPEELARRAAGSQAKRRKKTWSMRISKK
jgi:hypothetical protein